MALIPRTLAAVGICLLGIPTASTTDLVDELADFDIAQLMDLSVTSISKRETQLQDSASAVTVISQEDIRRSGATTVAELLRLSPGMEVARINANTWAISSRGFTDPFGNKLLVLFDGRSVYTPLFSGVFWDGRNMFLPDIDQIEIIRGPGATLWGANAVNGVVNVLSKPSWETQGTLIVGGGGTEEQGFFGVRHGDQLGPNTHLRVYGQVHQRDDTVFASGNDAGDDWWSTRGGFRLDSSLSEQNLLTVQGDIFGAETGDRWLTATPGPPFGAIVTDDGHLFGANMLARFRSDYAEGASLQLQTYYDRSERNQHIFNQSRDTFDIDFHHQLSLGERQEFIWGGGYRWMQDDNLGSFTVSMDPASHTAHLFNTFVQDEINVVQDRLTLTLGTKLEHNSYSQWEWQPNARLLWTPAERHSFWAATSRAVRTPSRVEHHSVIRQPGPIPGSLTVIRGQTGVVSEELTSFELGYRSQLHSRLSSDLALFYNIYEDLRTTEIGAPQLGVPVLIPSTFANNAKGEAYGAELALNLQATDNWRVRLNYSYLQLQIHRLRGTSITTEAIEGNSPHHQVGLRSQMNLRHDLELDTHLRYVGDLPGQNVANYFSLDAQLVWRPQDRWDLAIVGQNLLHNRHPEWGTYFFTPGANEIERGVYARLTVRF